MEVTLKIIDVCNVVGPWHLMNAHYRIVPKRYNNQGSIN